MCDLQGSVSSWRPNKKKETLPVANSNNNSDPSSSAPCIDNTHKNYDHSQ